LNTTSPLAAREVCQVLTDFALGKRIMMGSTVYHTEPAILKDVKQEANADEAAVASSTYRYGASPPLSHSPNSSVSGLIAKRYSPWLYLFGLHCYG
jgi:hypothetical protein